MSVIFNKKEIKAIFYNGKEIVQGWYNHNKVWEKVVGLFITGTVSNTSYVPRVYVNSQNTTSDSPSGGTWVDTVLEGNTWKVDLIDRLPLTGMAFMFYIAFSSTDRNRYIDKIVFPDNIDTSNVASMAYMFYAYSNAFTSLATIEGLENFDTSNVTDMREVFYSCGKLTTLDLSSWNPEKVTDMRYMFYGCSSLTSVGDLSGWDTGNVTNMYYMFASCSALTSLDISNWNTGNVTNMSTMFSFCSKLMSVGDLSNWNTSNVTTMQNMFRNCSALKTLDLSGWDTSKVTSFCDSNGGMFASCSALTSVGDLSNWNTQNVTAMNSMFSGCSALTSVGDLSNWNTSKVTTMSQMFNNCSKLESIGDLSNWNTEKVTNMQEMFYNCQKLTSLDFSNWNTSNVTSMYRMLYQCASLTTLGIPQIGDGTKSVSTNDMFYYSGSKLANITASGPIYNTVSFSSCPLTLASAKVVLNALQAPYSGAQSLTFRSTTVNLIQQDQEALGLVAEKVALGWTINVALPETIFRVNAGPVQDGLTVAQFPSGTQVTEYESGKYYQITACTADTVDFSGRDVKTALYLDYPSINTIDASDNSNLTKLVFNHENTNDMTIKFYNTGIDTDWTETINDLASKNIERSITLYFGSKLNVGDYQYDADGPVEDAYVVFTFNADGTYTDDWYGCKKYGFEDNIMPIDKDQPTTYRWIESTYAKPSDAPESYMYMSDSTSGSPTGVNYSNRAYFNIPASNEERSIDIYLNSYTSSSNYGLAFALDTDWTSTSLPAYNSTGVVGNTYNFQKDPSGSIATNYKKVTYTVPGDGQDHRVLVMYRKYTTTSQYYNKAFVLIPRTKVEILKPEPSKKATVSGTVTDTSKTPKVYVNSSNTSSSSPTGGTYVDTTLDGNSWSLDLTPYEPLTGTAFMFWNNGKDTDSKQFIDTISFNDVDTSNVTSMNGMFSYNAQTSGAYRNLASIHGLETFDTSNVTNMNGMFRNCSALTSLDLSNWNTSNATDMRNMFSGCSSLTELNSIQNWNTGSVRDMNGMFAHCSSLTSLDLSSWNTGSVRDMNGMFYICTNLESVGDLSNWNTSNVTDMSMMFIACSSLTELDLSSWNTEKVTNMSSMFANCSSLTELNSIQNWNTEAVRDMNGMFYDCEALTSLDLSNWNTSNVTNMESMFSDCYNLTSVGDLSNWNTSNVTNMVEMFRDCSSLTTLGLPQIGDGTKSVTTTNMFQNCSKLANITTSGPIYNDVDLSECLLTIESAKVVMNALQEPYNGAQTLKLGSYIMVRILVDPEAQQLAQEKSALGWTIS